MTLVTGAPPVRGSSADAVAQPPSAAMARMAVHLLVIGTSACNAGRWQFSSTTARGWPLVGRGRPFVEPNNGVSEGSRGTGHRAANDQMDFNRRAACRRLAHRRRAGPDDPTAAR